MDYRKLDLFRADPAARHVSRHGRPAPACPYGGMPAYESSTGALKVMACLVCFPGNATSPPLLLPMSYMAVVVRTQGDGLTALHDDPDAIWSWRPIIYSLRSSETQALGSQHELEYRRGLWDVQVARFDDQEEEARFIVAQVDGLKRAYGRIPPVSLDPGETGFRLPKNRRKRMYREYAAFFDPDRERPLLPYAEANERAGELLRENLSPQQRIDLANRGGFHVRGEINRLYYVELGNGFGIVDPVTHEQRVSLCLHPEEWMPYADVALATKLSIDAGRDSEAELLEAANPRVIPERRRARPEDRAAHRLEERHDLYP